MTCSFQERSFVPHFSNQTISVVTREPRLLALRTRIATGVPLIGDGCAPSSVGAVDYLRGVGRAHVERPRSMADARRELNNFGLTEGIE